MIKIIAYLFTLFSLSSMELASNKSFGIRDVFIKTKHPSVEVINPSEKEKLSLLTGICDRGKPSVQWDKDLKQKIVICNCPSFTSFQEREAFLMDIPTVLYGSFTQVNASEAIIDLLGCEFWSQSGYTGGLVLVRKVGNRWTKIDYNHTDIEGFSECIKITTNTKKHKVLCRVQGDDRGGQYISEVMALIEVINNKITTKYIMGATSFFAPPLELSKIVEWKLQDINYDTKLDLVVRLKHLERLKNSSNNNPRFSKQVMYKLTFLFNGSSFIPDTSTKIIMKKLSLFRG